MRIKQQRRGYFFGTHKGCDVEIERVADKGIMRDRWYIWVTASDGGKLYDGYAPEAIRTIAQAKREAIRGACL